MKKMIIAVVIILVTVVAGGLILISLPRFGSNPKGERLEKIKKSPNYREGQFRNLEDTRNVTSDKGYIAAMWDFLFGKKERVTPDEAVPAVKSDLMSLPSDKDWLVWFGHSSYLMNVAGKKILVDPVYYAASPVPFVNKPFRGTDIYKPSDLPYIDYFVISHDHWDHLDARTVEELNPRVKYFVCPLGVGAHLERWGVASEKLIELDWNETANKGDFTINCLPARHFTGRGLSANKTLWASYMLETPHGNIFIGGDSGYGKHFKEIGTRFPEIDIAILENGQYDKDWAQIHTLPEELPKVAADLNPKEIVTVHHSKFALAKHPWDEPLKTEKELAEKYGYNVRTPKIGEPIYFGINQRQTR